MNKKFLLYIASIAIVAASCTQDEVSEGDGAALCIAGVSVGNTGVETRTTGYATLTNGSMGVFTNPPTGSDKYVPKSNVCYTCNAGSWTTQDLIFLNPDNVEICAYYPYQAEYTDHTALPLQSGGYNAANDLGYAVKKTVNSSNPQTSFLMQRAYAKLTLVLKRGSVKDDCTVSSIILGAAGKAGLKKSTTLNIMTGVYAAGVAAQNDTLWHKKADIALTKGGAAVSRDYLLVPATVSGGLPVSFVLNDGGVERTINITLGTFATLAAGTHYTATLLINSTSVVVSGANIVSWTKDNAVNNGGGAYLIM